MNTRTTVIATLAGLCAVLLVLVFLLFREPLGELGASAVGAFTVSTDGTDVLIRRLDALYEDATISPEDVVIERARLNEDSAKDAIVRIENDEVCGSAGCPHELFIQKDDRTWERVPFGYSGQELQILDTRSYGYLDLELSELHLRWDGVRYAPSDAY